MLCDVVISDTIALVVNVSRVGSRRSQEVEPFEGSVISNSVDSSIESDGISGLPPAANNVKGVYGLTVRSCNSKF